MLHHPLRHIDKKKETAVVDQLMNLAAIVQPLTAIPQVYQIYTTQSSVGVSLWTWFGFMAFGLIFLAYAILHNIRPLIITQILWFAIDFLVVLGVILYA